MVRFVMVALVGAIVWERLIVMFEMIGWAEIYGC